MLKGIQFEKDCYEGKNCISKIIAGGIYQMVGKKKVKVNGMNILMYGILDVLKGGTIYDIKRVSRYSIQKYLHSYQHGFYLDLFERANVFKYLAYDDNETLHIETYYRGQYQPTIEVISNFLNWLKDNNLLDLYKLNWKSKGE